MRAQITPICRGPSRPRKPLTARQAAERNDERALLVAVRARNRRGPEDAAPRDLAALSLRLLDVNRQPVELDEREAITAEREAGEDVGAGWDPAAL